MRRGEIWWASLNAPQMSGPGYRRPVLIISANDFNVSRIQTVTIVALTKQLDRAEAPGNVKIGPKSSGLEHPSVVNVSQVLTIDKRHLTQKVRALPVRVMREIDDGLRLALNLV